MSSLGWERELRGHYFPYCQWCQHDGSCALLHHEFLGVAPGEGISREPYPGHENLAWHFSSFQVLGDKMSRRAQCTGRIVATDSVYFPLACGCGTVVDGGFCAKFSPNEAGTRRREHAEKLAKARGIALDDIPFKLLEPRPDPRYRSESDHHFPDFER